MGFFHYKTYFSNTIFETSKIANGSNKLFFALLAASASYIAVPAAMNDALPKANPRLYLPRALGTTFPLKVIIGILFYYSIIEYFGWLEN